MRPDLSERMTFGSRGRAAWDELQPHAGIWPREFRYRAGECLAPHRHQMDHSYYVVSGEFEITTNDQPPVKVGPGAYGCVRATDLHGVRALTDGIWLCLFALVDRDGRLLPEGAGLDAVMDAMERAG